MGRRWKKYMKECTCCKKQEYTVKMSKIKKGDEIVLICQDCNKVRA